MTLSKYRTKAPIAVCTILLATTSAAAIAPPPAMYAFNQPAEPLSQALRDVAVKTGRNVIAADAVVEARQAAALSGTFTAEQAVGRLLQGTGLQFSLVNGDLVVGNAYYDTTPPNNIREGSGSITVTGTRIRGVGSASPVTVSARKDLQQAGISDLADFTRILPQNYTGGQNRGIAGGGEQGGQENLTNSATLNLRGLGPDATLTLVNGHRLAYDGADQGIDISAIPLGAIDRVEVVSDGASALYGSDAVAGVANIILRRDYAGLETTARVGAATEGGDVQQEYGVVGGRRWTSGGFMLAVDQSSETPIYAGQRSFTKSIDRSLTLTDRNRQLSGVLSFHQEIVHGLDLELDGNTMTRKLDWQNPFTTTADVHINGLTNQSKVTSYALTPTLRADLGTWQASLGATGSDSRTSIDANYYTNSVSRHTALLYDDNLKGVEASGEGPLVALPGGDARLAIGGGIRSLSLHVRQLNLTGGLNQLLTNYTEKRNVQFAYGELSLPLIGPDLNLPLINRLTLSAALRYEHWNQIAAVTTPKLGLVYEPSRDLILRATWGKSFKIPTLYEINHPELAALYPGSYYIPATRPAGSTVITVSGTAPSLKPERATTWSATAELKPRIIPGLDFQATYFHIDYRDRIAKPITSGFTALYNPLYSSLIIYDPSAAQVNALVASLPGGLYNLTGAPFNPANVGAIVDNALTNNERNLIHGVDLSASYRLSFAPNDHLLLSGIASYLKSGQQLVSGQPLVPLAGTVFNPPHWRGRGGAVWEGPTTSISAFVNYIGSAIDNTLPPPEPVAAFVTLDLSASARTTASAGLMRNVELRLSALNVLNQKPRYVRNQAANAAPYDSTNESPVGRFIGASLRKVW